MSGTIRWKRLTPCFALLILFVVVQYYVVITNNSAANFLKEKFSLLSRQLPHRSRNSSGPLHVLVLSYARTGSTFLGELLQSHPKAFYHFEPLHFLSASVMNHSFHDAQQLLHILFRCNISQQPGFLTWQKSHPAYMKLKRSTRYWSKCSLVNSCYNTSFIDSFCANHSMVIVKTIRLGLREAATLFTEYSDLNLKIIYLVRDPRGTLNSRTKFPVSAWCKKDPLCENPNRFCAVLNDDLEVTCTLLSERPDAFTIIRYEDLSRDPFSISGHLIRFLELSDTIPEEIAAFLTTHTATTIARPDRLSKEGVEFPYSTFRNSAITSLKWRQEMPFIKVAKVQNYCRNVLNSLGYHKYVTSGALRSNLNFDKELQGSVTKYCASK